MILRPPRSTPTDPLVSYSRLFRAGLGAMFGDALGLICSADHEAADVLEEEQGDAPLLRQFDEMRVLDRALAEQHAVVREDRDGNAPDMREAANQRAAVVRLELVKLAAVNDPREHLVHVIGRADILREIGRASCRERVCQYV